ncbi:hypothetical protein IC582_025906 [Cucumis melo]
MMHSFSQLSHFAKQISTLGNMKLFSINAPSLSLFPSCLTQLHLSITGKAYC